MFGGATARLLRVAPTGVPQHIIQRGNNRQACFANEEDMKAYLHCLKELSKKYRIDVHMFVADKHTGSTDGLSVDSPPVHLEYHEGS